MTEPLFLLCRLEQASEGGTPKNWDLDDLVRNVPC